MLTAPHFRFQNMSESLKRFSNILLKQKLSILNPFMILEDFLSSKSQEKRDFITFLLFIYTQIKM